MPQVIGLPWSDVDDVFDYGGVLQLHLTGNPPETSEFEVIDCWAYQIPDGTPAPLAGYGTRIANLPARVVCANAGNGAVAGPAECGDVVCPTKPPRPAGASIPPTRMKLRVRRPSTGIVLDDQALRIESPVPLGPIYQLEDTGTLPTLMAQLASKIGAQQQPRIFHLYRCVDMRGGSELHKFTGKVIAVPVTDATSPIGGPQPDLWAPDSPDRQ